MIVEHFLKWKDSADVVRRAAAASALARAYLQSGLDVSERVAAEAALTLLLDDPSPKVRFALAEALAASVHAPPQIMTALVRDQIDIAAIVIARSPLIDDHDLIERARTSPARLQCLIAGRAEVSNPLAIALSRYGAAEAALVLVRNANARLCPASLGLLASRFAAHAGLRGALLERRDLSPALRYRLMKAAARALSASPLVRAAAGPDGADHLVRDGEQKALCTLLERIDTAGCAALVDPMRDHGDLTTVLLVRAACRGQIDFLASVLSALTDMPPQRVTAILVNERVNPLRALLADAGLADSVQPVFVHAVSLWRQVAMGRLAAGVQEVTRRLMERIEQDKGSRCDAANDDIVGLLRTIHLDAMRDNARAHARDLAAA